MKGFWSEYLLYAGAVMVMWCVIMGGYIIMKGG